ncbi:MAG: S8 family serine peptidase [Armatimonadota bacterium]
MNTSTLTVFVEDHACGPVTAASVTVRRGPRKAPVNLKPTASGQYEVHNLEPGSYTLRVSRRGYLKEAYVINVGPGRNATTVVLGKRGQPYFYANRRKVYFEPVRDQFLISAEGKNARELTSNALARRELKSSSAFTPSAGAGRAEDMAFVRVDLPGAGRPGPKPRRTAQRTARQRDAGPGARAMEDSVRELRRRGLRVTPALIVRRGDTPLQGLTNELVVKFEDGVSEREVSRIAARYGLKVKRRVLTSGNAYVLTTGWMPSYTLLDTARELQEKHPVIFAEPELLFQVEIDQYTPNDPLFNLLNHLPLIDCDDAWEILGDYDVDLRGGSPGVCIAVFDPQGVTPNHPDLTPNVTDGSGKLITSFNFMSMSAQSVGGLGGDHGTQCAGSTTAAFDNNQGTCGVAPNCRLIGARIPGTTTGVAMADAFLWAAGINNGSADPNFPAFPSQPADVISNSWGVTGAALSSALQNAFDRLTDEGRRGNGCVVTFSTGNLGYVQFSNLRTFAAYNRNIAVGASINTNPTSPVNSDQPDPNGNTNNLAVVVDTRTLYNPYGPEMDIVAPSHTAYSGGALVDPITSTVRVGNGTLDGCPGAPVCNDYATSFGGTSHASPSIAGTAALTLSANPLLWWDEARDVLRRTAVKIDSANTDPIGQYVDNDGDGVPEFSQWYGYGRVNVAAAVQEALLLYIAQLRLLSSINGP